MTPVSSSPTSCHLPNASGFIFLIDTSLSYSISIFHLSFSLHHSPPCQPVQSTFPRLGLFLYNFFGAFFPLSLVIPIPSPRCQIQHFNSGPFLHMILRWLIKHKGALEILYDYALVYGSCTASHYLVIGGAFWVLQCFLKGF